MKEYWVNIYADHISGAPTSHGARHASIAEAVDWATAPRNGADRLRYRLHVKLKPEGAPERYNGPIERNCWENAPDFMRTLGARVYA